MEVDGTHPFVYIALGSHAAYPARCSRDCDQRLAHSLPEGHFDGKLDWNHDATACCLPLPVTPEGAGAMWNAFLGAGSRVHPRGQDLQSERRPVVAELAEAFQDAGGRQVCRPGESAGRLSEAARH